MNVANPLRWPMAVLLVAHGVIHVLGFLWALDLGNVEEIGGPSMFITTAVPGEPAVVVLGFLWLLSMLALMTAGVGVARTERWGLPLAGIAASLSLIPTIVWWSDAWIGASLSAAIVVLVIAAAVGADGHVGRIFRPPADALKIGVDRQ